MRNADLRLVDGNCPPSQRVAYGIMVGTADISPDQASTLEQPQPTRLRRRRANQAWPYIRGAALSVTCVWVFVITYLAFTPRNYVSRWTLNLPGAASNVSLSLESIGQSSSTPNSPFSSSALSPKVVYKEIAEGERVRSAAARSLGLELAQFGKPRVKLIDETALMMFEMTATSAAEAKRRSDALMSAFNAELDSLRNDELEKRAGAVRKNLSDYQAQVRLARDNSIRAQTETGLVSTNQFAEMVSSLTALRRRLLELTSDVDKLSNEQGRLIERLGVDATAAGQALKLAADPALLKALGEYNDVAAAFSTDSERYGPRHPQFLATASRHEAARARVINQIDRLVPNAGATVNLDTLVTIVNGSPRADLYLTLVRNDATLEGKRRELASITADKAHLEADVARLSSAAARLEDLKKDQLVADAVLSTAMARLDSSKSDIYGSYPIVQVVAPPDIANAAAQPRPLYAALGGASGTLFACLAWMLAWLQFVHRSTRQKSA